MASIEKRGNLYSIRFRATVDGEKKNMRLSGFKTKKEARLAYEKAIREGFEVKRKTKKQYAEMTFEELTEKFIAWKQTQVKVSSAYDLKSPPSPPYKKVSLSRHFLLFFCRVLIQKHGFLLYWVPTGNKPVKTISAGTISLHPGTD